MEDFFTDGDYSAPQIAEYQPPHVQISTEQTESTFAYQTQYAPTTGLDFGGFSQSQPASTINYSQTAQNDFNDFEEDETTKRIRDQEERIQNQLRLKSQKQWNNKNERIAQGRRQLAEFQAKKDHEKQLKKKQNLEQQDESREKSNKINVQQGWHKVIAGINVRQGEHKGKKDINRMREAILHRREDQASR